jgi:hypothetical protein
MAPRFAPGAKAYTKDGRSYTVDDVEDGVVYCTSSGGGQTEFAEVALFNESEWAAKSDGRRDLFYTRLKQSRPYVGQAGSPMAAKLDGPTTEQLLRKIDRLSPGILDFAAFITAEQVMIENGDAQLVSGLSIAKSRTVFDEARPETRIGLVAAMLGINSDALLDAGRLGDNLMRALIEKGLAERGEAFEEFLDRPRR